VTGAGQSGSRPLVVAHISDLHMGAEEQAATASLATDVRAVDPDLTVVTGDCTMRARTSQFRRVRALLDELPTPRLVVLGNHDVPLLTPVRLTAPYHRYRTWIDPELDPCVQVPGLRALGLQSMPRWRWKSGRVSRRQAAAVVDVLGDAPPAAVRLLALHHPPFVRGPARIAGRGTLLRALAAARVDLVLSGHTHLPLSRRVQVETAGTATHRLVEVVAGTATSVRTRGAPRSWTVIRISPSELDIEERYERAGRWLRGRTARYPCGG
jgi:3',5'-cyclic AMP phosphodiesterase CpdA